MSAVPQQQDGNRSAVLPFSSVSRQAFFRILEDLGKLEPQIVADLEHQSEDDIFKLWEAGGQLEGYGWRIKCAAAAATWKQTAAAKRGRGNKDVNERGILAAVSKKSKKFGVTPSTVYRKAQIFRLMNQVTSENLMLEHNILDVLDEEGYWDRALYAADPVKAVLLFADKKLSLPRFRVTDAERLVLTEDLSRKAVALKAVENTRQETGQLSARKSLINHIRSSQQVVRNLIIPDCPDPEFSERVWEELLMELEEEYQELFNEDAFTALRLAWDQGHHREDQLAKVTKLPIADVSVFMSSLSDMSEFIRVQPRDMKRRNDHQLWHRVGEPFDNAKFMPMEKRV